MNQRLPVIVTAIALLGMIVLSAWAYQRIPTGELVPVHFDIHGMPDRYASPLVAFTLFPAVALLLLTISRIAAKLEPRKENLERSSQAWAATLIVMMLLLAMCHVLIVLTALSVSVDVPRFAIGGLGVVFVVIGNYLGKVRANYSLGIRNRWTLSNDRVWDKTHRFGGWMFVIYGLLLFAIAAFNLFYAYRIAFVLLLPVLVLLVMYRSYRYWQEIHRQSQR